jgi:tRNA A-37 threonylcarbamoyl transferase component Bud32
MLNSLNTLVFPRKKECELHLGKMMGKGLYGRVYETYNKNIVVKLTKQSNELKLAKKAGDLRVGPKVLKSIKKCGYTLIYMEKTNIMLYEWLKKRHTKKTYQQTYNKLMKLVIKLHKNNIVHGDIHIGNIGMIKNRWVLIDYGKTHYYKNNNTSYIDIIRNITKRPLYSNKGYSQYFKEILVPYSKIPISTKLHIYMLETIKPS